MPHKLHWFLNHAPSVASHPSLSQLWENMFPHRPVFNTNVAYICCIRKPILYMYPQGYWTNKTFAANNKMTMFAIMCPWNHLGQYSQFSRDVCIYVLYFRKKAEVQFLGYPSWCRGWSCHHYNAYLSVAVTKPYFLNRGSVTLVQDNVGIV